MQRSVQWGGDAWSRCFGVDCPSPTLYAYFACSIRNRLEVLKSNHFRSPMEGLPPGSPWKAGPGFSVKRPTKLIDGSRGGQAFIAEILAPESNKHYSIADQSRMQLLSVLLVGLGLTKNDVANEYIEVVLPKDFDLSPRLGSTFARLLMGLILFSVICAALLVSTWWSLVRENLYGSKTSLAWITKTLSLVCWAVGAMGLLMMGGNPRVVVVTKKVDKCILDRINNLVESTDGSATAEKQLAPLVSSQSILTNVKLIEPGTGKEKASLDIQHIQAERTEDHGRDMGSTTDGRVHQVSSQEATIRRQPQTPITIHFGSLHGSLFTSDRGSCVLPLSLVERICALDIKTVRSGDWVMGVAWFGLVLLASLSLQIGGILVPSFEVDLASLVFLLLTSLARGVGVSGPESWMIPGWKRRPNTVNGAVLMGQYKSRSGIEVA